MSIFSRLIGSKRAAEQQKAKQKEQASKPSPKPYRHVPQHAARDSMNLGPSVWQSKEDRDRRRSASIRTMNTQYNRRSGVTRNNSALSNVTTIHRDNSINGRSEYTITQNQRRPRLTPGASQVTFAEDLIPPLPLKNQEHKVEVVEKAETSPVSPISPNHSSGDSRSSSSSSQILELAPRPDHNDQAKPWEQNTVDRSTLPTPQLPRAFSNDNVNERWEARTNASKRATVAAAPQLPRQFSSDSVTNPWEVRADSSKRATMGVAPVAPQLPQTFSNDSVTKPLEQRNPSERASMMGPPSISSRTTAERQLKPWERRSNTVPEVPEVKVQATEPKKRDSRRWTFSKRRSTAIAAH